MTEQTLNLDDVTREVADVINNFELVKDCVIDGDIDTAKTLYARTLEQAKKFGRRLAYSEIKLEFGAVFDPNC
ncbi:hypothetical protein BKG93_02415 [Rodentibacter ratti]|uniref:Uncharacterized protein n=1 Tax=Rodentibacter ratti TaxID=1906745 RepID=A0A1V3LA78_9PAST|nr:hypothetical protein [Rodentibacter ratti]OOF86734.1 hypothetical protein BKG93_02415 [Rodentibacter ratti]